MESSLNFIGMLDSLDGSYIAILGVLLMLMANICHVIKMRFSSGFASIFAALSTSLFILILFGVVTSLFELRLLALLIVLSSYLIFLFNTDNIESGFIGSLIIGLSISFSLNQLFSSDWYLIAYVVAPVIIMVMSLIIGVASAIIPPKNIKCIIRISGFCFYFILALTLLSLIA